MYRCTVFSGVISIFVGLYFRLQFYFCCFCIFFHVIRFGLATCNQFYQHASSVLGQDQTKAQCALMATQAQTFSGFLEALFKLEFNIIFRLPNNQSSLVVLDAHYFLVETSNPFQQLGFLVIVQSLGYSLTTSSSYVRITLKKYTSVYTFVSSLIQDFTLTES